MKNKLHSLRTGEMFNELLKTLGNLFKVQVFIVLKVMEYGPKMFPFI